MMEEMSDLDKAAKESTGDESALDKELDVEKMAGEAQALAQESKES